MWLTILTGLIKIVQAFSSYLEAKQLMDAGEAKVIADVLNTSLARIAAARSVRSGDAPVPDDVRRKLAQRTDRASTKANPNTR